MRTTGKTKLLALVRNASRAALASATLNGRSTRRNCKAAMTWRSPVRVTPFEDARSAWRVTTSPALRDDPGIARGALGHVAVAIDLPGLEGARLLGLLLAERIGQQRDRFDVGPRPADIGDGDDAHALGQQLGIGQPLAPRGDDEARPTPSGKAKSRGAVPRVTCR